ncbi:hypothetical protein ACHAW6_013486 [Cyclotella cf. meneghiniana]
MANQRQQFNLTRFKATRSGQVVSVDQLISTQPVFFHLKGKLTTQQYKAATIFASNIHMIPNISSNEIMKAKLAFEQFIAIHFVKINTTMQTTATLQTIPSSTTAPFCNSDTPIVA